MVYYNSYALDDANKGLSICFIIAITIANCILIFKQFRKGSLLYTPRSLILTSLAIGDIFLALFVLVFSARLEFEAGYFTYDCSTYKAYISYGGFLIHFVYGLGLAVLAGEFLQRHRTPQPTGNTSSNLVKSIVYSACPWILGLIIILPLTMANVYRGSYPHNDCEMIITRSRSNAMYVVSVILPAILAVLACIAVIFVTLSPPYKSSYPAAVTYQGRAQGVVITSQNTNVGNATAPPLYPGSNTAASPYYHNTSIPGPQPYPINGQTGTSQTPMTSANLRPDHNHGGQIFFTPNGQCPVQQYPVQQYPVQQYPVQQYPVQQYPVQQYPVQLHPPAQYPVQHPSLQFPAQQYPTQSNVIFTDPTNVVHQPAAPNAEKEKIALLVAAIAYFLCVVPHASYNMHYYSNWSTVVWYSLFWLSVARSLVTPLIFILVNCSQFKRTITNCYRGKIN